MKIRALKQFRCDYDVEVMYLLLQLVSSAITLELECKRYCDEHNSTLPSSNDCFAFCLEIHGGSLQFVEMELALVRSNSRELRELFLNALYTIVI